LHADLVALGFEGSYGRVAAFARSWREHRQREQQTSGRGTFVPLVFRPGEAFQFDWSEDWEIIGAERVKLQAAHFKLCYSRACRSMRQPRQGPGQALSGDRAAVAPGPEVGVPFSALRPMLRKMNDTPDPSRGSIFPPEWVMPIVKFRWDAQLMSLRREVCPHARWEKATHTWLMTDLDAEIFLQAAQAWMYDARSQCTITVDRAVWVLGFVQGTPYRLDTMSL
jgi:hypothetical protein